MHVQVGLPETEVNAWKTQSMMAIGIISLFYSFMQLNESYKTILH